MHDSRVVMNAYISNPPYTHFFLIFKINRGKKSKEFKKKKVLTSRINLGGILVSACEIGKPKVNSLSCSNDYRYSTAYVKFIVGLFTWQKYRSLYAIKGEVKGVILVGTEWIQTFPLQERRDDFLNI